MYLHMYTDLVPGFVCWVLSCMWCSRLRFLKYLTPPDSLHPYILASSIWPYKHPKYKTIYHYLSKKDSPLPTSHELQTTNHIPRISPFTPSARPCSHQRRHRLQPPLLLPHGSKVLSPQSGPFSNLPPRKTSLSPMRFPDGLGREDDAVGLLGRFVESRLSGCLVTPYVHKWE